MVQEYTIEHAMQILEAWDETTVIQADDSLSGLDEFVRLNGYRKIVLFSGRRSADESGAAGSVLAALRYTDCAVVRFKDIPPEPDMQCVESMRKFLESHQPDGVIALGGGSVLDAAKAAFITFQTRMDLTDCFGVDQISKAFPDKKFRRIIAIPTTSGTGSEITQYSNIVNRPNGVKQLISDPALVPVLAVLNSEFTVSMPYSVTLATGCDALAHLLEGYLNVNMESAGGFVNRAAAVGISLVRKYLSAALADPLDKTARKALQLASALGGLTIRNKSTGLPHLLSFSWFDRIEHGIAVARLLPAAWRYYAQRREVAARTLEIGQVLGGSTTDEVIASYEELLKNWQVPHLRDYPLLDAELIGKTCSSAGANKMKLALAPRPVPLEKSREVLQAVLNDAFNI